MNLHDVPTRSTPPTDIPDDGIPRCGCGSSTFSRRESGAYWETRIVTFNGGTYPDDYADNQETELRDNEAWECYACGQSCDDDLGDRVEDSR